MILFGKSIVAEFKELFIIDYKVIINLFYKLLG
jgi:hypothetical protein